MAFNHVNTGGGYLDIAEFAGCLTAGTAADASFAFGGKAS